MSEYINYKYVSFVITENCSFQCKHCMRGDRRINTISKEVIDAVAKKIMIFGCLHLTGGEPLMRIEKIEYLLDKLYANGSRPRAVEVYTNGTVCKEKFETFIKILRKYCWDFRIMLSNDRYHREERMRLNGGIDNIEEVFEMYKEVILANGYSENYIGHPRFWVEKYEDFENGKGVVALGRGKQIEGAMLIDQNYSLADTVKLYKGNIQGKIQIQTDGRLTPLVEAEWIELDGYGREYSCLEYPIPQILKRRMVTF